MIEKILLGLINKERLLVMLISFLLGTVAAALGIDATAVKKEVCTDVKTSVRSL